MRKKLSKYLMFFYLCGMLVVLLTTMSNGYTETYTYDDLGRLTTVRYEDGKIMRYTYDPSGNITSRIVAEVTASQDHLLASEHSSFRVIREGKAYAIRLKNGETAEIRVQMIADDGSHNVIESEVTAEARNVDIDTLNQFTGDGTAVFTITGTSSLVAGVTFATGVGTLRLVVRRSVGTAQ